MIILIIPHSLIRTARPRPRIYQRTVRILNLKMKMGPIRKSRAPNKAQGITSLDGIAKRDPQRMLFKVPIPSFSIIRMSNYRSVTHCPIVPFQSSVEFSIMHINNNSICSGQYWCNHLIHLVKSWYTYISAPVPIIGNPPTLIILDIS